MFYSVLLLRERQAKLDELRTKKSEYQPGVWNVNTVLLGGLGKDPPLEGKQTCQLISRMGYVEIKAE